MSDTSQGPNWWIASDGKWYAPEQHPDYGVPSSAPPPPYSAPNMTQPWPIAPSSPTPPASSLPPPVPAPIGYPGVPQKTNGMAVASLILGIVWIAGIGSVLAVIFGFMSRKRIEQSQGRESGGGLSVAGIVLGFVGIVGAIGFWLSVVVFGVAVNGASSYSNGYEYGSSHYSSSSSESSVCSSSNVPSGDLSSSWLSGCKDAWSTQGGGLGNSGNTGSSTSGNSGNS
jgi:hypothetical protein